VCARETQFSEHVCGCCHQCYVLSASLVTSSDPLVTPPGLGSTPPHFSGENMEAELSPLFKVT
jgi:hypothetical protein